MIVSREMLKIPIYDIFIPISDMSLKITNLGLQLHLPVPIEFNKKSLS